MELELELITVLVGRYRSLLQAISWCGMPYRMPCLVTTKKVKRKQNTKLTRERSERNHAHNLKFMSIKFGNRTEVCVAPKNISHNFYIPSQKAKWFHNIQFNYFLLISTHCYVWCIGINSLLELDLTRDHRLRTSFS